MNIQWYPGHMTRARRDIEAQLKVIDIIIELVDARIPMASRNPDFDDLFSGKTRVVVLNKADLADPAVTAQWKAWYKGQSIYAIDMVATQRKTRAAIIQFVEKAMKPEIDRLLTVKGIHKTTRALICGIPNVGKSALINGMATGATAKTGNRPGVTRGTQLIRVTPYLELLDTPGILWPKLENELFARHLAYVGSIRDEIMDKEQLAVLFMEELVAIAPEVLTQRYKFSEDERARTGYEMLEILCRKRGLIRKGNVPDTERAATLILTEFRAGKLGRLTLEKPPEEIHEV